MADTGSINQLNLADTLRAFTLGQNPAKTADAGVVKQIIRHLDNRLNQVIFQQPTPNL